jgi:glycogen operon protein
VFRRRRFFQGQPIHGAEVKDLHWLKPDGTDMSETDWTTNHVLCLGMGLLGDQILETGERGERIVGDSFLLLFNAHHEPRSFRLASRRRVVQWTVVFDTADAAAKGRVFEHASEYPLEARSLVVVRPEPVSV